MAEIKYYPVGNGDCSLIKNEGISIITDCKIRNIEDGIYDVKKDLLNELKKRDSKPFTDLFILSHHDQDHCLNFGEHFYTGKVEDYNDDENETIIIDELWVNEYILSDETIKNDSDAGILRKEVKRRRDLYKNNNSSKDERGNRLVLVGYDANQNFTNVPNYTPGNVYNQINGEELDNLELFIHAPFIKDVIKSNAIGDRNMSSIVYQARFLKNSEGEFNSRVLHGGDADHYRWAEIKKQTEDHENQDALHWDIFLAPHHCSWTFFNDTPYKDEENDIDNSTPQQSSLDILDYKLEGAKIVTSSKEIKNDDDNPPHYPAKEEYVKKVAKENFLNTEKNYKDKESPIVFKIDESGSTFVRNLATVYISTGQRKPSRAG